MDSMDRRRSSFLKKSDFDLALCCNSITKVRLILWNFDSTIPVRIEKVFDWCIGERCFLKLGWKGRRIMAHLAKTHEKVILFLWSRKKTWAKQKVRRAQVSQKSKRFLFLRELSFVLHTTSKVNFKYFNEYLLLWLHFTWNFWKMRRWEILLFSLRFHFNFTDISIRRIKKGWMGKSPEIICLFSGKIWPKLPFFVINSSEK